MRQRRTKVVILHLMLVLAIGLGGFQAALPAGIALAQGNPPNGGSGQSLFLPSIGANTDSTAPTQSLPTDVVDVVVQASPTMVLGVVSARTEPLADVTAGDVVSTYKYIINLDNTGTTTQTLSPDCSPTSPGYPGSCNWVSIAGAATSSPIVTQGDQSDFAAGNGLQLPPGRYLISVLAEGYKLDGKHFVITDSAPTNPPLSVIVELQPTPLPTATIRAFVFEDTVPTNSAPDAPAEQGLPGFTGHIVDYLGEVQTDVFGNPLCTEYRLDPAGNIELDAELAPTVEVIGGVCVSDANGMLTIPNLGTGRYALFVVPPDGQEWIQTTTLEGNHDWDSWMMEGMTGFDTEFVVAGEEFPTAIFGFVHPTGDLPGGPSGVIKGVVDAVKTYIPAQGGLNLPGDIWGGTTGTKVDKPIENPWIALSDLNNGDRAIYVGQGNEDGSFTIPNVPDGNYTLTWWDEPQDYILDLMNVTVANGEVVDLGVLPLAGWWTFLDGYVFDDTNRNGVMDWTDLDGDGCPEPGEGELGVDNYGVVMRKRDNSLMDRGATAVSTDQCGYYFMENAYPLTQWIVMEAYHDQYYTTGVTYQADNQPEPRTILGAGVDVSVLPIIGLSGRLDWGVHSYDPTGANGVDPQNGGIVGTVSYDVTRNELDPAVAAVEDWQPGINGLTVNLWSTVPCGTNPGTPCDALDFYELAPDGSYAKGYLLDTQITETWERPTACVARDGDGNPLTYPDGQQVLPLDPAAECLEGPLMGVQFQNDYSAVDGNYGFGSIYADPISGAEIPNGEPIPAGAYLVEVETPVDRFGRPMYQTTREEDINIANGDQFVPQVPPPPCAGPLHTVDNAGIGATDGYPVTQLPNGTTVGASVPVENSTIADIDGNPYEGQARRLCDIKLVELSNGKSVAPLFTFFTEVPIPGRLWGLIVDDLNFSSDPKSLLYGEKAGVPFAPVGIYDYTNRLVTTVESDYNGLFDVLLPSTNRISCPTPSGVCANLYRLVGNDPGIPGRLNPNYNPQFRTIAAEFEVFPGMIIPADLAPTQVGVTVQLPGGQTAPVTCKLEDTTPQLLAVSQPYVSISNLGVVSPSSITIDGWGFGDTPGSVTLDGVFGLTVSSWSNTQIAVSVGPGAPQGPHQLAVRAANGQNTINGLTFHVLGTSYNPQVLEVGPGRPFATIQSAIDAAESDNESELIVVYPGQPDLVNPRGNPRGAYYENLVINRPVKLQGVGPGGFQGASFVPGSIIDGGAFGGDTPLADAWRTKVASLNWDGNQNVSDAAGIYILARASGNGYAFGAGFQASIDGFDIRGGNQMGFPNNINAIGGGPTGLPANVQTQGGAIFANAYANYLQITNNVIQNNGGSYGTVRIGTPDLAPDPNNNNDNIRIAHNRVIANAGTNLAGGIGLFAGADNYEVAHNDICGNFSAEYGGGISVYGFSPNGKIYDNRIYFNRSYDEGGGIMIAGQLPATPGTLSPGSGPVDIYDNLIQANLGNDDGGGIRFLMAGNFPMNVYNNMIVNNISTHEGGGIALDDAPDVRFYNNTVMKNMTTATAVTSNGLPAPAGLATTYNSDQLQATLPGGAPLFSNPLLFNNVFWDNRAGTANGGSVTGLGVLGDLTPINYWDMGSTNAGLLLSPTNSVLQTTTDIVASPTNSSADPAVVAPYDLSVTFSVWRNNPNFIGAILVTPDLPASLLGDYHLQTTSLSALNLGAASKTGVNAPNHDIDHDPRPLSGGYDAGADELRPDVDAQPVITLLGADSLQIIVGAPYVDPGATAVDDVDGNLTPFIVVGNNVNPYVVGDYTVTYDVTDNAGHAADQKMRTVSVIAAPSVSLYFSTAGDTAVPGVAGTNDDADVYLWNGTTYARVLDGSAAGLPTGGLAGNADIDALYVVDADTMYMSFNSLISIQALGSTIASRLVPAEDVVLYDNGTWTRFLDGSAVGLQVTLGSSAENVDAFHLLSDGSLVVSTEGDPLVGVTGAADEDLLRCVPGAARPVDSCTWSMYFDGSDVGAGGEDIDGASFAAAGLYFSTDSSFNPSGPNNTGSSGDVFLCASPTTGSNSACTGNISVWFTAPFNDNVDAISVP